MQHIMTPVTVKVDHDNDSPPAEPQATPHNGTLRAKGEGEGKEREKRRRKKPTGKPEGGRHLTKKKYGQTIPWVRQLMPPADVAELPIFPATSYGEGRQPAVARASNIGPAPPILSSLEISTRLSLSQVHIIVISM